MKVNKIYVLGDSFSANGSSPTSNPSGKDIFWVNILKKYYKDSYEILIYAEGSRDTQTIFDTWIKLLPKIQENDFLIIGFPYFSRYRFPRSEKFYKVENDLTIRHIGQNGAYSLKDGDIEIYDEFTERDFIEKKLIDNQFINSSKASSLNNKELIESLLEMTKCKTLLWSWTRFKEGFKPKDLLDKTDLENIMGSWGTQSDMYKKTNGKYGIFQDLHWDEDTQNLFFNFVKNKIEQ
jgi:hypothetical protein